MNRISLQEVIRQSMEALSAGGVLLYPADTIWGIGCDATLPESIKRVYAIKGRDFQKPLIVLVHNLDQLYEVVARIHPRIDNLLHVHQRPLTIVYPEARPAYQHLAAPDGSIGVRLVRPGFCQDLIKAYGKPLVSTSANVSGEASPTRFGTVSTSIIHQVDYVVPAFAEKGITGAPSVVAKYDQQGELDFLR